MLIPKFKFKSKFKIKLTSQCSISTSDRLHAKLSWQPPQNQDHAMQQKLSTQYLPSKTLRITPTLYGHARNLTQISIYNLHNLRREMQK